MNKTVMTATLIGTLMAFQCLAAEFAMPSAADIAKAAADPAAVAALLKGASPEQAAEIVKDAVSAVLGLNLNAKEQGKRIGDIVAAAMKAIPEGQQAAFAEALGKAVGEDALLRGKGAVVSAIQGAIASINGKLAGVFGVAYRKTAGTGVIATGLPNNTPSKTGPPIVTGGGAGRALQSKPAPPVARPYANQ